MQNHNTNHTALPTGQEQVYLCRHPLSSCALLRLICFAMGDPNHTAQLSPFVFLEQGHGSCGRTSHSTRIIKIAWVGTEEEEAPPH